MGLVTARSQRSRGLAKDNGESFCASRFRSVKAFARLLRFRRGMLNA